MLNSCQNLNKLFYFKPERRVNYIDLMKEAIIRLKKCRLILISCYGHDEDANDLNGQQAIPCIRPCINDFHKNFY